MSASSGRITRELEKFLASSSGGSSSDLESMAVLRAVARVLADELDRLERRLLVLEERKPQ
jgi:hypothetical protein